MWSNHAKNFTDDTLHISGQTVPTKRGELKHGDLSFWPDNPRIYSIVHQTEVPPDQEEIQLELLSLEHVKKLVNAIKHHGSLQHPIVVLDKSFEVIEGNSRLAAWRYLAQRGAKEYAKIPAMVLPADTGEDLIYSYLNQEHIEGKTKWSAYEQAGVIYRLIETSGKDVGALKDQMNISKQVAQKMYDTYALMVRHGEDKPNRYSYYEAYLVNSKAKAKRKKEPRMDDRIVEEIRKNEVTAQEFRKMLPVVCENSKEFSKFISGKSSLLGAYENLEAKGKTKGLVVQLRNIHNQVQEMKKSEFDALQASASKDAEFRLNRIITTLQNLKRQVYRK